MNAIKETEGYKAYRESVGDTFGIRAGFADCPYGLSPFANWVCPDVTMYDERFGTYLKHCADKHVIASTRGWVDYMYYRGGQYESKALGVREKDYDKFLEKCKEAETDYMA